MSNKTRIIFVSILTLIVAGFSAYVCTSVIKRDNFRTVDVLTIGFTLIAILKNIQIIYKEVKRHARK